MKNNIGDLFIILDKQREMTRLDKGRLADDLVEILAEEIRASMDDEQSFDGTPWAGLSADYAKWKTKHHPGRPIGELMGRMKEIKNIKGLVRIVFDRAYIEYAAGDPELRAYAMAFNDGRPDNGQPARPFLGFSERCKRRMAERIEQHTADIAKGRLIGG